MSDFDERSGVVVCKTPWGRWWQTVDEVQIEVECAPNTSVKSVKCKIAKTTLLLEVGGSKIMEGTLWGTVRVDDSTWTLEDKKLVRIVLAKAIPDTSNCWPSLMESGSDESYAADPLTVNEMKKKLTLQRMQLEHPGMDFSEAELSGNYDKGGPRF